MDNINNGSGIFDNLGLIDTLIVDCNDLTKAIMSGHYVQYCSKIVEMVQKLANLKTGVKADTESLQKEIESLKKLLDDINNGKE